ncbi:HMA2 domain-containing protein [Roseiarcus sp.]|uniref:HMA2 domain-containing protein n=1 Tax=Roseiarcus sp. TaxID=1969460 RepID=UPI003F9B9321
MCFPAGCACRAPILIGQRAAADQLQKSLARLDGVRDVEVSCVSGSVLFRFRQDQVAPDLLMGAVIRLLGLEKDVQRTPPSHIGEGIRNAGESLNHAIYEQTGGVIDLWTSLTLLLVVSGTRQLAAGNQFGWPLLWWAYHSMFPPERTH